jgi:hypothetical protein
MKNMRRLANWVLSTLKPINEGNYSDTHVPLSSIFYAAYVLDKLGVEFGRKRLINYLSINRKSISDVYASFYFIKTTQLLGMRLGSKERQRFIVAALQAINKLKSHRFSNRAEILYMSAYVLHSLGYRKLDDARRIVLSLKKHSNLETTYFVVETLNLLKHSLNEMKETLNFVISLQNADYGFSSTPKSFSHFIEDAYYGFRILELFGVSMDKNKLEENLKFVWRCQNHDGWFKRTEVGSISLPENCFYAINILEIISHMMHDRGDG